MSQALLKFLDEQNSLEFLMVSNISFWEIALLVQKGRLELNDIFTWIGAWQSTYKNGFPARSLPTAPGC
jgi:PIN domain nuclease of toxin-antitoxin system